MKAADVPDFVIPLLTGIQQGIREGTLEVESSDFEKLLGRPLTPMNEALGQRLRIFLKTYEPQMTDLS